MHEEFKHHVDHMLEIIWVMTVGSMYQTQTSTLVVVSTQRIESRLQHWQITNSNNEKRSFLNISRKVYTMQAEEKNLVVDLLERVEQYICFLHEEKPMPDIRTHLGNVLWKLSWNAIEELEHELQAIGTVLWDRKECGNKGEVPTEERFVLGIAQGLEDHVQLLREDAERLYFSYPVLMWALMKLYPTLCWQFRHLDAVFWISSTFHSLWKLPFCSKRNPTLYNVFGVPIVRYFPRSYCIYQDIGRVCYFDWEEIPENHIKLTALSEKALRITESEYQKLSNQSLYGSFADAPPHALLELQRHSQTRGGGLPEQLSLGWHTDEFVLFLQDTLELSRAMNVKLMRWKLLRMFSVQQLKAFGKRIQSLSTNDRKCIDYLLLNTILAASDSEVAVYALSGLRYLFWTGAPKESYNCIARAEMFLSPAKYPHTASRYFGTSADVGTFLRSDESQRISDSLLWYLTQSLSVRDVRGVLEIRDEAFFSKIGAWVPNSGLSFFPGFSELPKILQVALGLYCELCEFYAESRTAESVEKMQLCMSVLEGAYKPELFPGYMRDLLLYPPMVGKRLNPFVVKMKESHSCQIISACEKYKDRESLKVCSEKLGMQFRSSLHH